MVKPIYCLKCRKFTGNKDFYIVKDRERLMEKAICEECGKKKNRFIKSIIEVSINKEENK